MPRDLETPAAAAQGAERPVLSLRLDEIDVRDRIGFLWPERVETIAASMRVEGQIEPIVVRRNGNRAAKPWRLVAGWHRLEGARLAGLSSIDAVEVVGDAEKLRAIEAAENIHRRDLGPIEKALHVRALADVHEARYQAGHIGLSPQQIAIRARWEKQRGQVQLRASELAELEAENTADFGSAVYRWQPEAADAVGLSARKMRDYLLIHRCVIAPFPTLHEPLARHPLAARKAAVMAIAEIGDEAKRRAVIETIIADPEIKTIDEAMKRAGGDPGRGGRIADAMKGQSEYLTRAESNLSRLHPSTWVTWAPALAEQIKPSALTAVRDAIDARIERLRAAGKLKDGRNG